MSEFFDFQNREKESIKNFIRLFLGENAKDFFVAKEKVLLVDQQGLEQFFKNQILEEVYLRELFSDGIILCTNYISALLTKIGTDFTKEELEGTVSYFESWFAVDYQIKHNESGSLYALKKGGDLCFIICSIFPKIVSKRLVKLSYYQDIGISFYQQIGSYYYYDKNQSSKAEIWLHMSKFFKEMVEVVQTSIRLDKIDPDKSRLINVDKNPTSKYN